MSNKVDTNEKLDKQLDLATKRVKRLIKRGKLSIIETGKNGISRVNPEDVTKEPGIPAQ